MQRWIELHDSILDAVVARASSIEVRMTAYVHDWTNVDGKWRGSGWSQSVVVRVEGTSATPTIVVPAALDGGWLRVGDTIHDGLIPLPFTAAAPTRLQLDLVDPPMLEIEGEAVSVEADGEPEYVEELPDSWRPKE